MRTPTTSRLRRESKRVGRCAGRSTVRLALLVVAATTMTFASPSTSSAATPAPHWTLISQPAPSEFRPGDASDFYELIILNDGGAATTGPITVTDTLPAGVVMNETVARAEVSNGGELVFQPFTSGCETATSEGSETVTCTTSSNVPAGRTVIVNINVRVSSEASGVLANSATISGGGATSATATNSTPVAAGAGGFVPFGASLVSDITNETGGLDTQAGSHPFAFTTLLAFNVGSVTTVEKCVQNTTPSCPELDAQAKDVEVALPAGLVGNPTNVPYCKQWQFEQATFRGCPAETQVGSLDLYFYGGGTAVQYAPVYNIEPPPGQPGELGFSVSTLAHIPIFFHVRSDGDYGLTADVSNINQFDPVRVAVLSVWGNPADELHNPLRESQYGNCTAAEGGCPSGIVAPRPFLTLPTSCTSGSLAIPVAGDSWQNQAATAPYKQLGTSSVAGMTGCDALRFNPSVALEASTHQAGVPAGYDVRLEIPQNEEVEGLATPDVRDVEVAFPEGTVISPSVANGLVACSEAQFELKKRAKGNCPRSSKIGTVKIITPLLASAVTGTLFVGEPECSPCNPEDAEGGRMVHVLLEAEGSGVIIKLSGHTKINQRTDQLTAMFTENPQLPFSELVASVEPGPSAPLVNPSTCGQAVATAALTPWSAINSETEKTEISMPPVPIEGCGTPGFAPSFRAGTTSARGGAFTGFAVSLSRNDGEQALGRVSVTTPPGLLGVLKSVAQCPEAQANTGTCSAGSLIGSGSIVVGPGTAPLTINGGKVYLTGPYEGKPFGLSIVTPAQAGPFVLSGNTGIGTEVVRASIAVDPHTSALTVTSDPLPQALNGVPLGIRKIDIAINREGFMFSPTNCDAMSVGGTIASATGTIANVSYPFQSTDCGILPFKPKFTVSTQGKASKKNGASLHVKVTSGAGQANIAKVKVNLPIQLPSRLSTLQKACVDAVFNANPGSCPAASVVGQATAVTPLLAKPLTGPAYLVSHAGAAFPDLEVVLQGEGITLILDGNTQIKKGITSSIFRAVPDAPIFSFDLVLPEGPHSALAAFGNLCTSKLNMPTVITGQNGAVVRQTTKIAATGCPKHATKGKRKKS
jgi:hypothetical protein